VNWPLIILSSIAALLAFMAIQRFFSWRMGRRLDQMIRQIQDGTYESKTKPSPIRLIWDDDQVTVADSRTGESRTFRWKEIRSASAYKLDLVAYDQVCVAFEFDNDTSIEIDETMDGFSSFLEAAPDYLPGFVIFSDWYINITTPAFETNLAPLFKRRNSGGD
jgi:hypothetical protein